MEKRTVGGREEDTSIQEGGRGQEGGAKENGKDVILGMTRRRRMRGEMRESFFFLFI